MQETVTRFWHAWKVRWFRYEPVDFVVMAHCAATGVKLAQEFVENAVIEEDVSALLKYMRRYYNLVDVVEFGVSNIEKFLAADESNVVKFVDDGDLTTFLMIIDFHKAHQETMYHVFSILYILAKHRKGGRC